MRASSGGRGDEGKDLHGAGIFDVDDAAGLSLEFVVEQGARGGGGLNAAGLALGFHAAGEVHGVAPQIAGEFFGTDDTADDGAAFEADADLPRELMAAVKRAEIVKHIQGGLGA